MHTGIQCSRKQVQHNSWKSWNLLNLYFLCCSRTLTARQISPIPKNQIAKKLQKKNQNRSTQKCISNTNPQSITTRGLKASQRDLTEDCAKGTHRGRVPNLCVTLLSGCSLLHTWLVYWFFQNSMNCPRWEDRLRDRYRNYPSEMSALGSRLLCLPSVMALMALLTRLDEGSLSGAK